jgi:fused signal recognition particle receptor
VNSGLSYLIPVLLVVLLVVGFLVRTNIQKSKTQKLATASTSQSVSTPKSEPDLEVTLAQIEGTTESNYVPQDTPLSMEQRSAKLRDRLGRSQGSLGKVFKNVFLGSQIDDAAWQDLEDTLIMADLGVKAASEIVQNLKVAVRKSGSNSPQELLELATQELTQQVDGGFDRSLNITRTGSNPAIVLTVGVNGTGKTTTTGKLARLLSAQDKDVLLGAADTFRAAAAQQLMTWGERVGVPVVSGAEGSDPASVAFESVAAGIEQEVDVVLIDTAGRLHTKQGLMDELGKVYRVASKSAPITEVLLVIDATTGQNGLTQAKVFSEVVPVTGVVLSKLDGTAKGGIIIAIQEALGVPVKLVGLGEGLDDLAPFNAKDFVTGLLS